MKILFQGDSITDAGRDRSDFHNLGSGYPLYAAKYISEEINIYNGNSTCGGCIITRTTKTLNCTDMIDREDLYYVEE